MTEAAGKDQGEVGDAVRTFKEAKQRMGQKEAAGMGGAEIADENERMAEVHPDLKMGFLCLNWLYPRNAQSCPHFFERLAFRGVTGFKQRREGGGKSPLAGTSTGLW